MNDDAEWTNSLTVNITIRATAGGGGKVQKLEFSINQSTWYNIPITAAAVIDSIFAWTMPEIQDGIVTVYARVTDSRGGTSAAKSDSIKLDRTAPSTPGTPTAPVWVKTNTVAFNWTGSIDATSGLKGYEVYIVENPGGAIKANWVFTTATSYTLTGTDVLNGRNYTCKIRAVDNANNRSAETPNSPACGVDMAAPPVPVPQTPTCDNAARSVTVTWASVTDPAPGSGLQGYRIRYSINGGAWQEDSGLHTTASYTKTGLNSSQKIKFQVRALDNVNNSSAWSTETAEACLAALPPVKVNSLTSTSWNENGTARYKITVAVAPVADTVGYKYYRKLDDGTVTCVQTTTSTSYEDTDLEAHGLYEYGYRTYNAFGVESAIKWADSQTAVDPNSQQPKIIAKNIPPSTAASGPPSGGYVNSISIDFTLGASKDVEDDSLHYKLYTRSPGSGSGKLLASWIPTTDDQQVTASFDQGVWEWQMRCIESDGDIPDRTEVAITEWIRITVDTQPPAETFDFKICALTGTEEITSSNSRQVRLLLTDAPGDLGEAGLAGAYYWTGTSDPGGPFVEIAKPVVFSIDDTEGAVTTINLTVVDKAGNKTTKSKSVRYDTGPPNHPAIEVADGIGKVNLSWEPPAGEPESLTYKIFWRRAGETDWNEQAVPHGAMNATVPSGFALPDNTLVELQVVPRDPAGNEQVKATPDIVGCTLAANGELAFQALQDTRPGEYIVRLTPGGQAAASYRIYRGDGDPVAWRLVGSTPVSGYVDDPGRQAHASLVYKLVAVNSNDSPRESDAPQFTYTIPNTPPATPIPIGPAGLTGPAVTLVYTGGEDWDNDEPSIAFALEGTGPDGTLHEPDVAAGGMVDGLLDGYAYSWTVTIDDGHGGVVTSAAGPQFTVDAKPPVVHTNFGPAAPGLAEVVFGYDPQRLGNPLPVIMIHDERSVVATVRYKWDPADGEDPLTWPVIPVQPGATLAMPDGARSLAIHAADQLGNARLYTFACNIDGQAPAVGGIAINHPVRGDGVALVNKPEVRVSFSIQDNEGGTGLKEIRYYFVPAQASSTAGFMTIPASPRLSSYSICLPGGSELVDGVLYYAAIAAVDLVGNESVIAHSGNRFLFDASAPVLTELEVTGYITHGNERYFAPTSVLAAVAGPAAPDPHSGIVETVYAFCEGDAAATVWASSPDGIPTAGLTKGRLYSLAVRVKNGVGLTATRFGPAMRYDDCGPEVISVTPETAIQRDPTTLRGTILAVEPDSAMAAVELAVGTTSGGTEVVPWRVLAASGNAGRIDYLLDGLNLADGVYHLTARARNALGQYGAPRTVAVEIDSSLPARPLVRDEGDYASSRKELYCDWEFADAPEPVDRYEYRVVTATDPVTAWTDAGTATEALVIGLSLADGTMYYLEVRAVYASGGISATGRSNGIIVDSTPPPITSLDDGDWTGADGILLNWAAHDEESGLREARFAIGTAPGESDISHGWLTLTAAPAYLALGALGQPLALEDGRIYYVTVKATNWAGGTSAAHTDGVAVDKTPPPAPCVRDQGAYHNLSVPLAASWAWDADWRPHTDPQSGIAGYEVAVITDPELSGEESWQEARTNLDYEGPLAHGETYYFFVKATNGAGLSAVGRSDGITVDGTTPSTPRIDDGPTDYYGVTGAGNGEIEITFIADDLQSGLDHFVYAFGSPDAIASAPETATGSNDFTESFPVTDFADLEGETVLFRAVACNGAGEVSSEPGYSDGFMVDIEPPADFTVSAARPYSGEKVLRFNWTLPTSDTPLRSIRYVLVTSPGLIPPVEQWTTMPSLSQALTIVDDRLVDGETYYLRVAIADMAGNESVKVSDGITVDLTPPGKPEVTLPNGSWCSAVFSAVFGSEDGQSGIALYECALGSTRGAIDLSGGWIEVAAGAPMPWSAQFEGLQHGQVIYFSVRALNRAGLYSETWSSRSITVDLTTPESVTLSLPESCGQGFLNRTTLTGVRLEAADAESMVSAYVAQVIPVGDEFSGGAIVEITPTTHLDMSLDFASTILSEGAAYKVAAKVRNGAGEWSAVQTSPVFIVDLTPPELNFTGPAPVANPGETVTVDFQVTESGTIHFELRKPDSTIVSEHRDCAAGPGSFSFVAESPGGYLLAATPTDLAGNSPPAPTIISIHVNYAPVITQGPYFLNVFGEMNQGATKGQELIFKVMASDAESNSTLSYEWDFGDGAPPEITDQVEIRHAFNPGEGLRDYTATVTIRDEHNGTCRGTVTVVLVNTSRGRLYADETWFGTHHIDEDVIVDGDHVLTVDPGTTVLIKPGCRLIITESATLRVNGGAALPVAFNRQAGTSLRWGGIIFAGAATGDLDWAVITHAERGTACTGGGTVTLDDVTFSDNITGLHCYSGTIAVNGCTFAGNTTYGIKEDNGCSPLVRDCVFRDNAINYYDEILTEVTAAELNTGDNSGNQFLQ